jgi:hypothetical protein
LLFCIMATPRLLNTDAKNWSVDRGRDPAIHKRWHSPSIWRWGHLDLQWLPLQREQGPCWGWGCLLSCPPFRAFSAEMPFLPTMVAGSGYRPQSGGSSLRAAMRPWCSLSFYLLLIRFQTYRHMYTYRHG